MTRTLLKRLAVGVGAVALTATGMMAGTANAETPVQINPDTIGSITVHKHVKDETSPKGAPKGAPLSGVKFTVQEVLNSGASIELGTAEGWVLAESVFEGTAPALPAGFSLENGTEQSTDTDGETTFGGLNVGVYLVTETGSGPNLILTPAVPFFVALPNPDKTGWDYDVDVYPKNVLNTFEVTKTPVGPSAGTSMVVGQTIDWNIVADIPAAPLAYESLTIADTLSTGLTFNAWKSISIGATALVADTDYTVDPTSHDVTLTAAGLALVNEGRSGAQTLTAVITTNVVSVGSMVNKATVTLNGQQKTGEGTTNWGKLNIKKVSATDPKPALEGAVFELYAIAGGATCDATSAAAGTLIGEQTTATGGLASWSFFIGNKDATTMTVCLKETAAPTGHVLPANPFFAAKVVDAAAATSFDWGSAIENHRPAGPLLPATGAAGTLAFSIFGLGLIGAAAALGMRRKARATN